MLCSRAYAATNATPNDATPTNVTRTLRQSLGAHARCGGDGIRRSTPYASQLRLSYEYPATCLVSLRSTSKESSLEEIQSRITPAGDIYHRVVFRIPHRFTGARFQSLALSRLRATGVQFSLQDTAGIQAKTRRPGMGRRWLRLWGPCSTPRRRLSVTTAKRATPSGGHSSEKSERKGVGRSSSLPSSNISLSVEMAGNFCVKSCEDALLFNNRVSISAAH